MNIKKVKKKKTTIRIDKSIRDYITSIYDNSGVEIATQLFHYMSSEKYIAEYVYKDKSGNVPWSVFIPIAFSNYMKKVKNSTVKNKNEHSVEKQIFKYLTTNKQIEVNKNE